ncbi:MAG: 1-acyl-sn-glycerol-3-phosphate acyltransferase [Desulfosudis oleivorans]|nr:1-acyl-sn-glycerol-3-phosphate acyltransferase [Desulfosudis oleivorans]
MNHVNFFDPLVFQVAFPPALRGVEEESHFRWPVYGGAIRRIGMFPISRKDTARAIETMRRAAAWVRERPGFSFGVMPEGTRTLDGQLGPFKRGGFILAVDAGLEVLPLVQSGAFEIARKGSLNIRPGKVAVTIAPPVPSAGYSKENRRRIHRPRPPRFPRPARGIVFLTGTASGRARPSSSANTAMIFEAGRPRSSSPAIVRIGRSVWAKKALSPAQSQLSPGSPSGVVQEPVLGALAVAGEEELALAAEPRQRSPLGPAEARCCFAEATRSSASVSRMLPSRCRGSTKWSQE